MVQVLPAVPTFGQGLVQTLVDAGSDIAQGLMNRGAKTRVQSLLGRVNGSPQNGPQIGDQVQNAASQGVSQGPITINELIGGAQDFDRVYGKTAPAVMNTLASKIQADEKAQNKRIEKAEPLLLEKENKLESYEQEALRFDRLAQLFSPELDEKFPSPLAVGLFTKDGEISSIGSALLSPEAQEAVKLVADNLSGAKDTFGARVTNFDLQAYMKRLPTLINSAEGRRRVLRDLRIMNKLNTNHEKGVLDIIEREGGPGNISLSQAERRYKKENAQQIKELKEEFVNPEKKNFSDKPDASLYSGRQLVDEETGEKFRSNGKEWVLE